MNRTFLTVEESAHCLRISRAKMYEILKTGAIPVHRFGKCIRIKSDDLLTWANTTRQSYHGELEPES